MIHAIYMSDLAQAYFPRSTPRSASAQLHRWIKLNTDLQREWKPSATSHDNGR